jgi:amidase
MSKLWERTATEIAELVATQQVTAVEVIEQTITRLNDVNPRYNAVVQSMPDEAISVAVEIDQRIQAGKPVGPLVGVPVTIKVNIDQQDCANTNGLRIQKDNIAETDSPVVANLRQADAIIVGRTNTPAFSMRWFTRNSLHGHTLNPRNTTLTPGGSSGGAAAAVSAGMCAIGHGTDIAGSIRYPAYACGLHGIRPSLGRVPAVNLSVPDRHIGAQLTAVSGPIARSINDLKLGLDAMSASSDLDPWYVPVSQDHPEVPKRVALCLNPDGLEVDPAIVKALQETAKQLVDAGWEVTEVDSPPIRKAMHKQILLWMSDYHYNDGVAIAREDDPDTNIVYPRLREYCPDVNLTNFMDALQYRVTLAREWKQFFSQYPILLCPVSGDLPFADLLDIESDESFHRIIEAQLLQIGLPFIGIPAMTVTTGSVDNTPVGIQLVASNYREDVLFAAASDIEARNQPIRVSG